MGELKWAWSAEEAASVDELDQLREISPIELPRSYLELLSRANGYEVGLSVDPLWLILYPAREVIEIMTSRKFNEFFPDFFVIGGNGGLEVIALNTRGEREGAIVSFDMTNIDLDESVFNVARDFDDLLTKIEA